MKTVNINNIGKLLLVSLLIILFSINNVNAQTSVDYDHAIDFSKYKTFTFKRGVVITNGVKESNNNLVSDKLKNDIVPKFEAKGLKYTDSNPDLIISFISGAEKQSEVQSMGPQPYDGVFAGPGFYGGGGWWSESWNNWWVRDYTEGTLIIDLIDAKTKKLVWRSISQGEVKSKQNKQDEKINKEIEKALKDFPPKNKK